MKTNDPTPLADDAFHAASPRRIRRPWWLRLLVALGGLTLLLFGGCLIFSMFCRGERVQVPPDLPEEVFAVSKKILSLELPPGYAGELAEIVETPMFAVRKAIFRHESGKGVIALTAVDIRWKWVAPSQTEWREALAQLTGDMRSLSDAEATKETIVLGGQPVEFEIRAGQDALSSTKLHEVRGLFPTKVGMTQFWWQAEDDVWSVESEAQLLKSLAD